MPTGKIKSSCRKKVLGSFKRMEATMCSSITRRSPTRDLTI